MSKNSRDYWYDYVDINNLLKSTSNDNQNYRFIEAASQDDLHLVQKINQAYTMMLNNPMIQSVVVPINLGRRVDNVYQGRHWVGLVIRRNPETNDLEALYNDSLGNSMCDSLPALKQILINNGIPESRITDFKYKQQDNSYDCGAWTVLNLNSLARTGQLPDATENDIIGQRTAAFGYVDIKTSNIKQGKIVLKDTKTYKVYGELFNDEESVNQDISNGLDEFKNLKIGPLNYIKFIINVPMYVTVENMSDTSSDEDDDGTFGEEKFNFDLNNENSFPYRSFNINITEKESKNKKTLSKKITKQKIEHRVGLLESDAPGDRDKQVIEANKREDLSKAHNLLALLTKEGFNAFDKSYMRNIAVSIGLNRPHSLSTRKNDCLKKELHKTEKSEIQHKKAAFFWDMPWTDKDDKVAHYEDVRKFYRQLKKKDPAKAKKFLQINEEEYKPFPPYQYIREYLKEHQNTKALVESLNTKDAVIYFSSIDSDTKNFNGIYSSYLNIIEDSQNLPTVMSTGYEFGEEDDGFPLYVGSKLERIIRIITAKTLAGGVYYPEPNFCVLIPYDKDTLPYSFVDKKMSSSNLESPVLLRQILEKSDWIFSDRGPLITSGDRAQKKLKDDEIEFSHTFQNGRAPNEDDLGKLSQIIQSTAHSRAWALGVYYNKCFTISGSKGASGTFNKYITCLFKDDNIENTLTELRKMVKPSATVNLLYEAVKNVRYAIEKFCNPFEEGRIQDDELYKNILQQFYHLRSCDIITIIDILKTDELYNALNGDYSLYEICQIYQTSSRKFESLFSKKSGEIYRNKDGVFEDVNYEKLEELYDQIIQYGGTSEDFESLLNDSEGSFSGNYGDLDFNEIKEKFLSFFNYTQNISYSESDNDINNDENIENKSAYECAVNHFRNQFEKDYGDGEQDSEQEEDDTTYLSTNNITEQLRYPVGSYEDFQHSILGYQNRIQLPGANFIAASNLFHVPGARNTMINQLDDFRKKLENDLNAVNQNNEISYDTLVILQSCPKELLPYLGFDSTYMESIDNIQRQIYDVSNLQDLLRNSLDNFPDNSDTQITGLSSFQGYYSDY